MMNRINLGIIGAGLAVELLHWPALQALTDQFNCLAVADIEPSAAQRVAALVGAPQIFADYHDLLRQPEIEAVLIALPIHLQGQALVEAAQAGKHVMCEKPPAANLEQAGEVQAQVAGLPVTILIAENFRYRQDLQVAHELLAAGRLGEIVIIRLQFVFKSNTNNPRDFAGTPWRHDAQYRGGPVLDGGVHHAAALRDLGGPIEWVQAFTKYGGTALGGITSMIMNVRFRSGALGSMLYSAAAHSAAKSFLTLHIYGSTAGLAITDGNVTLLHADGSHEAVPVPAFDNGYRGEFENFYSAIRAGEPVKATLAESCADLALIMYGLDAAEQASVLLLPPEPSVRN